MPEERTPPCPSRNSHTLSHTHTEKHSVQVEKGLTNRDNEMALCVESLSREVWPVKKLNYSLFLSYSHTLNHTPLPKGSDQIGALMKRPPRKRTRGRAGTLSLTHTHSHPPSLTSCSSTQSSFSNLSLMFSSFGYY